MHTFAFSSAVVVDDSSGALTTIYDITIELMSRREGGYGRYGRTLMSRLNYSRIPDRFSIDLEHCGLHLEIGDCERIDHNSFRFTTKDWCWSRVGSG